MSGRTGPGDGGGAFPSFSICGMRYYISGEVAKWRNLANPTCADLEATGIQLHLDTLATSIDVAGRHLEVRNPDGSTGRIAYDELVVGTGALPVRPRMDGLDALGVDGGVHLLHSIGDTFALTTSLNDLDAKTALIVGHQHVRTGRPGIPKGVASAAGASVTRFGGWPRGAVQQDPGQARSAREGCPWG